MSTLDVLSAPQSVSFTSGPASGVRNLSFGQFDPSLGTLDAVVITLGATLGGTDILQNLQVTPAQVTGSVSGAVTVADLLGNTLASVWPGATQSVILAPGGAVALTFAGAPVTTGTTAALSGVQVSAFSGTGTVALPVLLSSFTAVLNGGGNLASQTNVTDAGTVTLQYSYIPATPADASSSSSGVFVGFLDLTNNISSILVTYGSLIPTATTSVQTQIIADQTTNWSQGLSFARFDPSLGKLDDVVITEIGDVATSLTATDLGPAGAISASVSGSINLASYANLALVGSAPSVSFAGTLGGAGASVTQQGTSAVPVTRYLYDDADLAVFTGPGSVTLTASASALGSVSGPADLAVRLTTQAGVEVQVSYIYEPGTANPLRALPAAAQAAACFAAGTRMLTEHGLRPIEAIRVGERVMTHRGESVVVVWRGQRTVFPARHAAPWDLYPVHVAADAFGPGVPARELVLSPDHAIFFAGGLIPVRFLINGSTIAQRIAERVTWHHLELPAHDVLLAENLPTESYLDTGNRAAFESEVMDLQPRFSGLEALEVWRLHACARLVRNGPELAAARRYVNGIAARMRGRRAVG